MWLHLPLCQRRERGVDLILQQPLVALIEDDVVVGCDDHILTAQAAELVDPVVRHLHPGLKLFLIEHGALVGRSQLIELVILPFQIGVVPNGPLQLHDVGGIFGIDRAEDPAKPGLDGVLTAMLAEEAELDRVDLNDGPVVNMLAIDDQAIFNGGEAHDLAHVLPGGSGVPEVSPLSKVFLRLRRAARANGVLLLEGSCFALENSVFFFSPTNPRLLLRFLFSLLLSFLFPRKLWLLTDGVRCLLYGVCQTQLDILLTLPQDGLLDLFGGLFALQALFVSGVLLLPLLFRGKAGFFLRPGLPFVLLLPKNLLEGKVSILFAASIHQHLIVVVPGKLPIIPKVTDDINQEGIVGLFFYADEKKGCNQGNSPGNDISKGKVGNQDKDQHCNGKGSNDDIPQPDAVE